MLNAPIPYLGSKRLDIKYIIDNKPDFNKIIDVFGGGGSVSMAFFQLGYDTQYNDIDPTMCELFEAIQDMDIVKKIVEKFNKFEVKEDLKEELQNYKDLKDLDSMLILKAYAFRGLLTTYMVNRRKKNGELIVEQHYKPNKLLKYPAIFKENKLKVSNLDFKIILEENKLNKDMFLYLDPPYLTTHCGDYTKANFIFDDINYLKEYIKTCKCQVMLHIEFTGYIYDIFKDFIKVYYPKNYALSKNPVYQKYICIITNYDI